MLRAGIFNGGSVAYICKGEYDEDRNVISGELWAYRKSRATFFGGKDYDSFSLGRDKGQDKLIFCGRVDQEPERTITAEFTWLATLAR